MRNLVISPIGDKSIHKEWLRGQKNFDFMGIYYGDDGEKYKEDCDFYIKTKGYQWKLMQDLYNTQRDFLAGYDAIWCPGDDIRISTEHINRTFEIFHEYKLKLAQPGLFPDRGSSHWVCNPEKGCKLRYTNFVEALAPMFTFESFSTVQHTFSETVSGWGMDWVWPKLLDYEGIAIIDETLMWHTKPIGIGATYKALEEIGSSPGAELTMMLKKYEVEPVFKIFKRVMK